MIDIDPIDPEIIKYLRERGLTKKFNKQIEFFRSNPAHPSLNFELLRPNQTNIFSIRIDRKYRALFVFTEDDTVSIIEVNNHYQ